MRAPPEAVRTQIQQLLVDRMVRIAFQIGFNLHPPKVRRMGEEARERVMSFVDRGAEERGGEKTPWGVFLTNALPLGELRQPELRNVNSFIRSEIFKPYFTPRKFSFFLTNFLQ